MSSGDAQTADSKLREESSLALQIGVVTAVHVVALVVCILRIYSRVFLAKAFGWDDGFMVGATVCGQLTLIRNICAEMEN